MGGWTSSKAVKLFSRYVAYCAEHLGDYVTWWVTINEPTGYATLSYMAGMWVPFRKNPIQWLRVFFNLAHTHNKAYKILKKHKSTSHVGIAHVAVAYTAAHTYNPLEAIAVRVINFLTNHYFLRLIKNNFDYIGINYYLYKRLSFGRSIGFVMPPNAPRSDFGWEIAPQGMLQVLREFHRYRKPLLITENGLADAKDSKRWPFIVDHLAMVYAAISEGINVVGYLYWALTDNFEWAEGFAMRFGLIEVNYATQERTIRPSALKYAEIAKANAIAPEMLLPFYEQRKDAYPEIIGRHLQRITRFKPEDSNEAELEQQRRQY
jgi:beta-glucosidase